ncbi:hypothetical protein HPB50_011789 [Hyalomma asiaticum]|uniref:Uncharacterized protein n=1 Tax=Hyalomma asiaticum TaxID=266040 RepID=A0ACB7S658_HYAAI|nr:hypothetical protein HPB50_011789 [Hyalomma asiaticum]
MTDERLFQAVRSLEAAIAPVIEKYAALAEAYGSEGSCVTDESSLGTWTTVESEGGEDSSLCCGVDAADVPRAVSRTAGRTLRTKERDVEKRSAYSTRISTPTEGIEATTRRERVTASRCAPNRRAKATDASETPAYSTEPDASLQKSHSTTSLPNVQPCPLGLWRKKAPKIKPHDELQRILGKEQWDRLSGKSS